MRVLLCHTEPNAAVSDKTRRIACTLQQQINSQCLHAAKCLHFWGQNIKYVPAPPVFTFRLHEIGVYYLQFQPNYTNFIAFCRQLTLIEQDNSYLNIFIRHTRSPTFAPKNCTGRMRRISTLPYRSRCSFPVFHAQYRDNFLQTPCSVPQIFNISVKSRLRHR